MFLRLVAIFVLPIFLLAKEILVIQSYSSDFSWDKTYTESLSKELGSSHNLTFFEMNTKNIPKSEFSKMAEKAFQVYEEKKPDLVVLGDDNALQYVGPLLENSNTPIVYLGINNNPRHYFKDLPDNITGVLERPNLKRSVVYLSEIIPDSKKILILFDDGVTSDIVKSEYFGKKDKTIIDGCDVEIKQISSTSEWEKTILDAKDLYDFIIVGLYQTIKDESGKVMSMDNIITWTSENSQLPLFGFWDFSIGKNKTIGGYVISAEEMGKKAAVIVKMVFNGKKPQEILPISENDGRFLFSKSQVEKWKLDIPKKFKVSFIE
ncbi:MAG: sugar ABC transporter [Candidatus Delongbacteria bacterium]|nr:sugar ABC transporter [Candidatus Delongbacteria bacterium]MBN2835973.1 sugar ABC transporter [Candidatus Delongbacteria bacterium]